jgi:metal-dependent amidase/aminoacylase/carboxypeptidase family protein
MNTKETSSSDPALARLAGLLPELEALYTDVHAHPELSMQETRTAGLAAERLRATGYDVTTAIGTTGVVGLLRNGAGPTVMLRADMDALPVEEAAGCPMPARSEPRTATGRRCRSCMPAATICMSPGSSARRRSSRKPATPGEGP